MSKVFIEKRTPKLSVSCVNPEKDTYSVMTTDVVPIPDRRNREYVDGFVEGWNRCREWMRTGDE